MGVVKSEENEGVKEFGGEAGGEGGDQNQAGMGSKTSAADMAWLSNGWRSASHKLLLSSLASALTASRLSARWLLPAESAKVKDGWV